MPLVTMRQPLSSSWQKASRPGPAAALHRNRCSSTRRRRNMQFRKTAFGAIALGACACMLSQHPAAVPAAPHAILDIFDNRALKCHEVPASGPDQAVVQALDGSDIGKAYYKIRPDRSVLMYDCSRPWCSQREFNIQSAFTEAAVVANSDHPDPKGVAVSWYKAASDPKVDPALTTSIPTFTSSQDAKFHLLAIANRMDLAEWDGSMWNGAEIHFVYGFDQPVNLTLIFEFQLPPLSRPSFQSLAKTWSGLSTVSDADYPAKLLDAIRCSGLSLGGKTASRCAYVRVRMNDRLGAGLWKLSQVDLHRGNAGFSPADLDDQISDDVMKSPADYGSLWTDATTKLNYLAMKRPDDLIYSVPNKWVAHGGIGYSFDSQGMPTPPGICNPNANFRNVLAIQQCKWCHTTESNTCFTHIPNVAPTCADQESQGKVPSQFLIGPGTAGQNLRPALGDLYYGNESVVWSVAIKYNVYGGAGCTTP